MPITRFLLSMILLLATVTGQAQHLGQHSLFMQDRYGFNPAYGGMERSLAAGLHYRSQWAGLEGNPEYRALTAHMPFYLWQGGVGVQLTNQMIGAERQTTFALSYNFVAQSTIGVFSAGLRAGLMQKRLDGTRLRAPEGFYEGILIDHLDPNLPNGVVSGVAPLLDGGIYFVGQALEAGLSLTGYLPGGISLGEGVRYAPDPVWHLFAEYKLDAWDGVTVYPGAYAKSDLNQTQTELYVRASWNDLAQAMIGYRGLGPRSLDALVLSGGVRLSHKFFLYYAYDVSLSSLSAVQQGTHELMIRYNLGKVIGAGLPPRIIYNPRNL